MSDRLTDEAINTIVRCGDELQMIGLTDLTVHLAKDLQYWRGRCRDADAKYRALEAECSKQIADLSARLSAVEAELERLEAFSTIQAKQFAAENERQLKQFARAEAAESALEDEQRARHGLFIATRNAINGDPYGTERLTDKEIAALDSIPRPEPDGTRHEAGAALADLRARVEGVVNDLDALGETKMAAWRAAEMVAAATDADGGLDDPKSPRLQVETWLDQLQSGVRENEDGTHTLLYTAKQVDRAKREGARLVRELGWDTDRADTGSGTAGGPGYSESVMDCGCLPSDLCACEPNAAQLEENRDVRPQLHGWAPGPYAPIECGQCGDQFCGAKRAVTCAPCAYGDREIEKRAQAIEDSGANEEG